jgi:phenylalanyl-tRNA synthetase beta chain
MHPKSSTYVVIDNEVIGFLGKLHPNISKDEIYVCEINLDKLYNKKTKKIKYEEPSKYPNVNRDLAFLFDKNIVIGEVLNTIKYTSKILINTSVFDIFEKDGKKSVAFSLTFNNKEKTLTEEEINVILAKIVDDVTKKYNGILRDK